MKRKMNLIPLTENVDWRSSVAGMSVVAQRLDNTGLSEIETVTFSKLASDAWIVVDLHNPYERRVFTDTEMRMLRSKMKYSHRWYQIVVCDSIGSGEHPEKDTSDNNEEAYVVRSYTSCSWTNLNGDHTAYTLEPVVVHTTAFGMNTFGIRILLERPSGI